MQKALTRLASRLLIAAVFAFLAVPWADAELPSVIHDDAGGPPLWISEATANRNGQPAWDLFDEIAFQRLQGKIARSHARRPDTSRAKDEPHRPLETDEIRSRCVWVGSPGGMPAPGTYKASDTLDALLTHSTSIFVGRVQEQATGFLGPRPGTLYRVRVQRVFEGSAPKLEPGDEVLLYYPEAMVQLGDDYICSTAGRDFAKPSTEGRVLVFQYSDEPATPSSILRPDPDQVIFDLPSGSLAYPPRLQENLAAHSFRGSLGQDESMDRILREIEERIAEKGEE